MVSLGAIELSDGVGSRRPVGFLDLGRRLATNVVVRRVNMLR